MTEYNHAPTLPENEDLEIPDHLLFRSKVESILNTRITPESLDLFFENALTELIDVADEMVDLYSRTVYGPHALSKGQIEDAAAQYFDVPSISSLLDYLQKAAEQSSQVRSYISRLKQTDHILVPPDLSAGIIPNPDSEDRFTGEINLQNRLEQILFLVTNTYGLMLEDETQISTRRGEVSAEMMRQTPYDITVLESLNRIILSCDESGNITFVLDLRSFMRAFGIRVPSADVIAEIISTTSKDDLKSYIAENPGSGTTVIYSEYFLSEIGESISKDLNQIEIQRTQKPDTTSATSSNPTTIASILGFDLSSAPEVVTKRDLYKEFGAGTSAIYSAIRLLGSTVSQEVSLRPYGDSHRRVIGFPLEDAEVIRSKLREEGYMTYEERERLGLVDATSVMRDLGLSKDGFRSIVALVSQDPRFGEIIEVILHKLKKQAFTPLQVSLISAEANRRKSMVLGRVEGVILEAIPEGFKTLTETLLEAGFADLAQSQRIREKILADCENNEGFGQSFSLVRGLNVIRVLSPGQQQIIINTLQYEDFKLQGRQMTEGEMSISDFVRSLSATVHRYGVERAISILMKDDEDFGMPDQGLGRVKILTPKQQGKIIDFIEQNTNSATSNRAEKIRLQRGQQGYVVVDRNNFVIQQDIPKIVGFTRGQVDRVIQMNDLAIGSPQGVKTEKGGRANGFTAEQVEIIRQILVEQELLKAPAGIMSANAINLLFGDGIDRKFFIEKAILQLQLEGVLGTEIPKFKFGGFLVFGFDTEQSNVIASRAEQLRRYSTKSANSGRRKNN
jgi:hypothetical protein